MFATWIPGRTQNGIVESQCDIIPPDLRAKKAWVMDIFNGTTQELNLARQGNDTVLKEMLVKDYPVFIKLELKGKL